MAVREINEDDSPTPVRQRSYNPVAYLLDTIITLILLDVALRLLLKFFGANPNNGFVSFIYNTSYPLVVPFSGIFALPDANTGVQGINVVRGVFETATLLALVVYSIVAAFIHSLMYRD